MDRVGTVSEKEISTNSLSNENSRSDFGENALRRLLLGDTHHTGNEDLRAYVEAPESSFLSSSSLPEIASSLAHRLNELGEQLYNMGQFRGACKCSDLAGDDVSLFIALVAAHKYSQENNRSTKDIEAVLTELSTDTPHVIVRTTCKRYLFQTNKNKKDGKEKDGNVGLSGLDGLDGLDEEDMLALSKWKALQQRDANLVVYQRRQALLVGVENIPNISMAESNTSIEKRNRNSVLKHSKENKKTTSLLPIGTSLNAWLGYVNNGNATNGKDAFGEGNFAKGEEEEDEDETEIVDLNVNLFQFNIGDFDLNDPLLLKYEKEEEKRIENNVLNGDMGAHGSSLSASRRGVVNRKSILATAITGGGDPERSIVAYWRFEKEHWLENIKISGRNNSTNADDKDNDKKKMLDSVVIRDVGSYGHHGTLLGANVILSLSEEECSSPMEQLRKQTQHSLCCHAAEKTNGSSSSSSKREAKKKKSKKKKSEKSQKDQKKDEAKEIIAKARSILSLNTAKNIYWGMIVPINWIGQNDAWNQQTLQLGYNQEKRHRNHRSMTFEMWLKSDCESIEDKKEIVLFARGVGGGTTVPFAAKYVSKVHAIDNEDENNNDNDNDNDNENSDTPEQKEKVVADTIASPFQWSLRLCPMVKLDGYRLEFRTSSTDSVVQEIVVPNDKGEEEDQEKKTGILKRKNWYHVAMTIDNNSADDTGRVTLLVNGKQVAQGNATSPINGGPENLRDDCGLFIMPNVELFRVTEIRLWAQARPQHDIDATKDWTLKMAKKTRGGKKRGAGLFKGVKIKALVTNDPKTNMLTSSVTKNASVMITKTSLSAPKKIQGLGGPPPSGGRRRKKEKDTSKDVEKKKKKKKKKKHKEKDKEESDKM